MDAAAREEDWNMSDFVYVFRIGAEAQHKAMGTPERAQQTMERWLSWIRKLEEQGHLKPGGQPLDPAGKVVRGKQKTVTDGPYMEAKDLVNGFLFVDAKDLAQATELAAGCPMLEGDGSVEVRPVRKLSL
jgi:hypothetical protein